jgi:hypothetical protein
VLSKREMRRISRSPEYHAAVLSHEKKKLAKAAAVSVVAGKSKDQVHGAVETETKNDNVTKPHICCRKEFELKTKSPPSDIQSGLDKESWDRVGHNYQKEKSLSRKSVVKFLL